MAIFINFKLRLAGCPAVPIKFILKYIDMFLLQFLIKPIVALSNPRFNSRNPKNLSIKINDFKDKTQIYSNLNETILREFREIKLCLMFGALDLLHYFIDVACLIADMNI